jgi:hypothetical protein
MRIISEIEIEKNENKRFQIEEEMLTILRIGGCKYICESRFNIQKIYQKHLNSI